MVPQTILWINAYFPQRVLRIPARPGRISGITIAPLSRQLPSHQDFVYERILGFTLVIRTG